MSGNFKYSACVLWCSEASAKRGMDGIVRELELGGSDELKLFGTPFLMGQDGAARDILLKDLALSAEKHHVPRIVVASDMKCFWGEGARSAGFDGAPQAGEAARAVLAKMFPHIPATLHTFENARVPADAPHACVVGCMDGRIAAALERYFWCELGLWCDELKLAGGAKGLADGGARSDILLEHIGIAVKSGAERICLVNHEDCGKYGGSVYFAAESVDETAFHRRELKKARAAVAAMFRNVPVHAYYLRLDGSVEEIR